jgi:nucleotide-binding universal stress UspA family protein
MFPPKSVVFPVDYSEVSRQVVPYIKDFLAHFPAELTLLHAYDSSGGGGGTPFNRPGPLIELNQAEAERLGAFASEMFSDLAVTCVLEDAETETAIRKLLKREGGDLVMMPSHEHVAMPGLFLGPLSLKMLHELDCAVWVAHEAVILQHSSRVPYRSILCALDAEESEATILAASSIAKAYGADLALVHVVELPAVAVEVNYEQVRQEVLDAADMQIRELTASLNLDAPYSILEGGVAEGIREDAVRRRADLIVTGRGRIHGGLGRLWAHLGAIVRTAPCPVLSL